MIATITRTQQTSKQVTGVFVLQDSQGKAVFRCKTLELPWRNNERQRSCIPVGTYEVVPRTSPKFAKHYHIKDVPNRDWILIHTGNYHTQILGCVLVGATLADINGDGELDVTSSRVTLNKILALAPKGFQLIVQ